MFETTIPTIKSPNVEHSFCCFFVDFARCLIQEHIFWTWELIMNEWNVSTLIRMIECQCKYILPFFGISSPALALLWTDGRVQGNHLMLPKVGLLHQHLCMHFNFQGYCPSLSWFQISQYKEALEEMQHSTRQEYIVSLRRYMVFLMYFIYLKHVYILSHIFWIFSMRKFSLIHWVSHFF